MKILWIFVTIFAVFAAVFAEEQAEVKEQGGCGTVSENEADTAGQDSTWVLTDVDEIVKRANLAAYYQGRNGRADVKMVITDKNGQMRHREFVVLRSDIADGGDQKYFVYFKSPADVRKMVFMVHKHIDSDDDRWLYLPSLDLVKRIAAGDKRTSFVGSDFLYEDVSGRSLAEDTHALAETTEQFYVIKNILRKPESVEFGYYNVAVDRKTFVPVKMEYFDKNGRLYRVIEAVKIECISTEEDGTKKEYPTVVRSVVSDLNTGSKTEMEFGDIKYNMELEDIFTERYLRRPPRDVVR